MVEVGYIVAASLLLPLVGSVASLLMRTRPRAHWTVIICLTGTWLSAALLYYHVITVGAIDLVIGTWMQVTALQLVMGLTIDSLSATVMATVATTTLAGMFYHASSARPLQTRKASKSATVTSGRIDGDETVGCSYPALVAFLTFSALLAVSADSYLLLFAGWEGVAVSSWLLLSWRTQRLGAMTFCVQRIGSAALALATILLLTHFGTANMAELTQHALADGAVTVVWTVAFVGFLTAAATQAGLFPFHMWLEDGSPDQPVTTVVVQTAATVPLALYLLLRSQPLFAHNSDATHLAVALGLVGAVLMALAALSATDVTRILAYSTSSQAGLIAAAAVTTSAWGTTHLVTHSLAKCGLILGSAAVYRALTSGADLARAGGLRGHLQLPFYIFLAGVVVLSGLMPPGLSNYAGMLSGRHPAVQAALSLVLAITSLYLWRLLWLLFLGKARSTALRPATGRYTTPLVTTVISIMAVLALCGGALALLGALADDRSEWGDLRPALPALRAAMQGGDPAQITAIVTAPLVALLGLLYVWLSICRTGVQFHRQKEQNAAHRLLARGYYGGEIFEAIMGALQALARGMWTFVDTLFLDLICSRGPALLVAAAGWLMAQLHNGRIDWYLTVIVTAACVGSIWVVIR